MMLKPSHKLIISAVGAVLVIAVLVIALVVPQIGALGDLDEQIKQADQDIQRNETTLKRRQEAKQRAAATDAELMRLANELPESPELPALIIELQDAVNESGLEFTRIDPEQEYPPGSDDDTEDDTTAGYRTVSIEMEVLGRWQDTVDLLQRMRRISRQIRVERIESTREEEAPAGSEEVTPTVEMPNLVRTKILIEVYTMPSETDAPAPTAPAPTQ
jgi:Tfp pilus assembly protein PilO